MLTRAILLVLLIAASVYGWNVWRGPKLLRVPFVWTSMSRRHADLAEALRLRASIGRLLLQAKDLRAERILKEVDLVINGLVQLRYGTVAGLGLKAMQPVLRQLPNSMLCTRSLPPNRMNRPRTDSM